MPTYGVKTAVKQRPWKNFRQTKQQHYHQLPSFRFSPICISSQMLMAHSALVAKSTLSLEMFITFCLDSTALNFHFTLAQTSEMLITYSFSHSSAYTIVAAVQITGSSGKYWKGACSSADRFKSSLRGIPSAPSRKVILSPSKQGELLLIWPFFLSGGYSIIIWL